MKKTNISILLILCFIINIKAYTTDSLLRDQITATNNVTSQIKKLSKENSNLTENKIESDSMVIVVSDFEKIATQFNSISNRNLTAINEINSTMEAQRLCWFEKALPHIIGGLITVIGAYLIYKLGWLNERKKIREEENRIRKEKNDRLSYLIESSIRIAKKILSHLTVFQFKVYFNPSEFPTLGFTSIHDIKRLSKLFDDDKYYHAFLKKYNSNSDALKNFNNISGSADYFITQIPIFYDWHKSYKVADTERKNEYLKIYNKIEIDAESTVENRLNQFLLNFMKTYYSLNSNGEKIKFLDLDFIQKKFTEPLVTELNKNFKKSNEAKYLLKYLNKAEIVYSEIQKQNLEVVEDFKNELNVFKDTIVILESIYNTLNKKES